MEDLWEGRKRGGNSPREREGGRCLTSLLEGWESGCEERERVVGTMFGEYSLVGFIRDRVSPLRVKERGVWGVSVLSRGALGERGRWWGCSEKSLLGDSFSLLVSGERGRERKRLSGGLKDSAGSCWWKGRFGGISVPSVSRGGL